MARGDGALYSASPQLTPSGTPSGRVLLDPTHNDSGDCNWLLFPCSAQPLSSDCGRCIIQPGIGRAATGPAHPSLYRLLCRLGAARPVQRGSSSITSGGPGQSDVSLISLQKAAVA
ncbi:unnamed protein product [Closterium sp. NIES-54]